MGAIGNASPPPPRAVTWRTLGQSVRGAAHERAGLPNQDAIRWLPADGLGPPLILAVSDGHGSAKYFRSHIGASLAVEKAVWLLDDLRRGQPEPTNLSAVKRTAEERLPRELVRAWSEAVREHLRQSPLTPAELETLEQQEGRPARRAVEKEPLLAYGATALAVMVTEAYILYLQLGDGDILVVGEDGRVNRPLERDERLFANQTTSLCSADAWRDVQVRFQARVDPLPALILLSSDGYANSFVNDAAFLQVGSDIYEIMCSEGLETVQAGMVGWLEEASRAGSGDDITLGILCRADILPSSSPLEMGEPVQLLPAEAETPPEAQAADVVLGPEDEFTVTVTVKRKTQGKK